MINLVRLRGLTPIVGGKRHVGSLAFSSCEKRVAMRLLMLVGVLLMLPTTAFLCWLESCTVKVLTEHSLSISRVRRASSPAHGTRAQVCLGLLGFREI